MSRAVVFIFAIATTVISSTLLTLSGLIYSNNGSEKIQTTLITIANICFMVFSTISCIISLMISGIFGNMVGHYSFTSTILSGFGIALAVACFVLGILISLEYQYPSVFVDCFSTSDNTSNCFLQQSRLGLSIPFILFWIVLFILCLKRIFVHKPTAPVIMKQREPSFAFVPEPQSPFQQRKSHIRPYSTHYSDYVTQQ